MELVVKNPANAGDVRDLGLIPRSGRSPGGGHGNPLQYSCLENPMDRGAWQAMAHRFTTCTCMRQSAHAKMLYILKALSGCLFLSLSVSLSHIPTHKNMQ